MAKMPIQSPKVGELDAINNEPRLTTSYPAREAPRMKPSEVMVFWSPPGPDDFRCETGATWATGIVMAGPGILLAVTGADSGVGGGVRKRSPHDGQATPFPVSPAA